VASSTRGDIRRVAAEAGVSTATVSRVLSGRGPASAGAAQKVRSAAAKLDYLPNASASSLRTDRSMIIGVLVPNLANPVFLPFLRAVEQMAQRRGYSVIVADTQHSDRIEAQQLDRLSAQRVDGLIMAGRPRNPARVGRWRRDGLPVTDPYTFAAEAGFPLESLASGAIGQVCRDLADFGHTRIGYLTRGAGSRATFGHRWELIGEVCRSLAIELDRVTLGVDTRPGPGDLRQLAGRLEALVHAPHGPTVLWSNSHVLAPVVLEALALAHIDLPGDCSFVTFGDSPWAAAYRPSISVIESDMSAVAEAMTAALLHRLGSLDIPPVPRLTEDRYIARESVGPAPNRRAG
jgi:DNA-binding LacI/PurR family transcriptional regulator